MRLTSNEVNSFHTGCYILILSSKRENLKRFSALSIISGDVPKTRTLKKRKKKRSNTPKNTRFVTRLYTALIQSAQEDVATSLTATHHVMPKYCAKLVATGC